MTTLRYLDEYLQLKCSSLLLELNLFPNAGEITESFGIYNAFRRYIQPSLPTRQTSKGRNCIICVGDGVTPRTAAVFALRLPGWEAIAIDPIMRGGPAIQKDSSRQPKAVDCTQTWTKIQHLKAVRAKIQDVLIECDSAIVILLHAHVTLLDAIEAIRIVDADESLESEQTQARETDSVRGILAMITCPCCQFIKQHDSCFGRTPDLTINDPSIASPRREIRIWSNLDNLKNSNKFIPNPEHNFTPADNKLMTPPPQDQMPQSLSLNTQSDSESLWVTVLCGKDDPSADLKFTDTSGGDSHPGFVYKSR